MVVIWNVKRKPLPTANLWSFVTPDEARLLEPAPVGAERVARLRALLETEPLFVETGGAGIVGLREDEAFAILDQLAGNGFFPFQRET